MTTYGIETAWRMGIEEAIEGLRADGVTDITPSLLADMVAAEWFAAGWTENPGAMVRELRQIAAEVLEAPNQPSGEPQEPRRDRPSSDGPGKSRRSGRPAESA